MSADTEMQALRAVYSAARRVLRFRDVDEAHSMLALRELDAAVERVKAIDSSGDIEARALPSADTQRLRDAAGKCKVRMA